MLRRMYVDNYRCFTNFTFQPGGSSLLVGANGSGKSSVLDVLHGLHALLAQQADIKDAFPAGTLSRFADSRLQRFELDLRIGDQDFRYKLALEHDPAKEEVRIAREELLCGSQLLYEAADGEVHLPGDAGGKLGPFPYPAGRSYLGALEPRPDQSAFAAFQKFITGIRMVNLDVKSMTADSRKEQAYLEVEGTNFASWFRYLLTESPSEVAEAVTALREYLPGFKSLKAVAAGRSKLLMASFQFPKGRAYELDFEELSDGQRALIVLYTLLHVALPSASVFGLDETDNYLSIQEVQPWLAAFLDAAEERGVQVIVVSHSPEVINFMASESAWVFERPDGGFSRVARLRLQEASPLQPAEALARGWHETE